LEAAGEHEAREGMPTVGKAGGYLWQQLARVGLEREPFRIHNVLSCQPPNNKLAGMPYEIAAVACCAPLLDDTIHQHVAQAKANGRHPTILALGVPAFKRIMGLGAKDLILKESYHTYPFWADKYSCWVIPAFHPSFIMRGNHQYTPTLQFAAQRAVDIARDGLALETPIYLLDPNAATFAQWAQDYLRTLEEHPETPLSYDIETPYKKGKKEDQLTLVEEGESYIILRCGFSYRPGEGVSVPWTAEYRPTLEALFASPGPKVGWNSSSFDEPRVRAQMAVEGDQLDAMLMWHILNSALDKDLGFVTPFYVKTVGLWKHLSDSAPALYNCYDADMCLRNYLGIKQNLIENKQWSVFERHVVELNRVLHYMSKQGVPLDQERRLEAEKQLTALLDEVERQMEAAVPQEARTFKVYKKTPKDTTGMVQVEREIPTKICPACGEIKPLKAHGKVCQGEVVVQPYPALLWAKPLEFKVSIKGLSNYQKALKHQAIMDRRKNKTTFNKNAIKALIKKYPKDPLYPIIDRHRELQKLKGTYVGTTLENGQIHGGLKVGLDGRVHTTYCLTGDHEVLTHQGWERLDHLQEGESIVQWNSAFELSWAVPEKITKAAYTGPMLERAGRSYSLNATPNHRTPYFYSRSGMGSVFKVGTWESIPQSGTIPVTGYLDGHEAWSYWLALAVAIQADGCIESSRVRFGLSKSRKLERLQIIASQLGLPWKQRSTRTWQVIEFQRDALAQALNWLDKNKTFDLPRLLGLTLAAKQKFIDEVTYWDGSNVHYGMYSNTNFTNIQTVASLAHVCGQSASVSRRKGSLWSKKQAWSVTLSKKDTKTVCRSLKKASSEFVGYVYCVTLPDEFFLVRRNGIIGVTGNTHNPTTLRLASQDPDMQNIPERDPWQKDLVKNLIVAAPGHLLVEFDYSGIEAILVGYFACDPSYIRLARLGVHSYVASHVLGRPADLTWSDEDLRVYFREIKKSKDPHVQQTYYGCKRAVHLSGYGGTPHMMHRSEPDVFPLVKEAARLQGMYFDLLPQVRRWQMHERLTAEKDGFLRNPFNYVHRFNRVFRYEKVGGKWEKKSDASGDGNKALAFRPSSTAAAIIKEVMLRLYLKRFEEAGQYLRLQVHDSLVSEVPEKLVRQVVEVMHEEMTRPVPELPLPASYGMGTHLNIGVEWKVGERWGECK